MDEKVAVAFALVLLCAVLISGRAQRTLLSTSVVFLIGGFFVGPGLLKLSNINPQQGFAAILVEFALVTSLFTDGMRLKLDEFRQGWGLSGRALLLAMPLTFLAIALLVRLIFKLPWLEAFLIGAVLSPTDPVFASLLLEQKVIPLRLRRLLNIESGLNDGLALPVIVILLRVIGSDSIQPLGLAGEILGGILIGIAVPWIVIKLETSRFFSAESVYETLAAFSIEILVLSLCMVLHTNEFLAMYTAGVTIATRSETFSPAFERFGEVLTELLKAAALFLFGMLIQPALFRQSDISAYIFALLVLFLARPLPIFVILTSQKLTRLEVMTAAWFGPKGFASIFYALLLLKTDILNASQIFNILALTIIISIILHSSSDIFFTRWFTKRAQASAAPTLSNTE